MRFLWILIFVLSTTAAAKPICPDCNVVVIALDATQAAHMHFLGYPRETTPNLDKLAARSYIFQQAISPSSWTIPTYLSIFSAMYPSSHGLTNRYLVFNKKEQKIANFKARSPEIITMAQVFKDQGYVTGGFTGDAGLSAVLGYDKGFDQFSDETQFGGLENSWQRALTFLDRAKGHKFFLFVHGYDNHGQFKLPADFVSPFVQKKSAQYKGTAEEQAKLRELGLKGEMPHLSSEDIEFWRAWYDGKIKQSDVQVGRILEALEARGLTGKTLVVVFSDHGTEFFEHGRVDHGHTLYDELIHVPLLIAPPDLKHSRAIAPQVSTQALLPTVLEIVGIAPNPPLKKQMQAISFVPAMQLPHWDGENVFSETDYRAYTHKRSIRTRDSWKYIMTLENGGEELFDLKRDPGEQHNLAAKEKTRLTQLKNRLMKHLSEIPSAKTDSPSGCLPVYPGQCD